MKHIIQLMMRSKIPMSIGGGSNRRCVKLTVEQKLSVEIADELRVLTLENKLNIVWSHIANEGKRTTLTAVILKAMGLIPGAPDLVFLWRNGCGFIEIKVGKNPQSPEQKSFQHWCDYNNVPYIICKSLDDVLNTLKRWEVLA